MVDAIKVYVDWARNFDFSDAGDDITDDVIEASWSIGMSRRYEDVADGGPARIVVNNSDGKYTPENSGSTLYPNVKPHRPMQIVAVSGTVETRLWRGWLQLPDKIYKDHGSSSGQSTLTFEGVDGRELLLDLNAPIEIQENVTADVIVAEVLKKAQLPPAADGFWILGQDGSSELGVNTVPGNESLYSDLETGKLTIPTFGDLPMNNAWDLIRDATLAERGRFFFDREGKAVWWNRHHLLTETTVAGTVTDVSGDYVPLPPVPYSFGADLANVVRVSVTGREEAASGEELWSLDGDLVLPAGVTKEIEATLRREDGRFAGAETLAPNVTYTGGTVAATVQEKGGKALVTLVNSSTEAATITSLTLTGAPTTAQNLGEIEQTDADSLASYGRRGFRLDVGALSTYSDADNVARFELNRRASPIGIVDSLDFTRALDDLGSLLDWDIGTRLNVALSKVSHDQDYFVMGQEFTWQGHNKMDVRLNLEPAEKNVFWILGKAGFSEVGVTTLPAY